MHSDERAAPVSRPALPSVETPGSPADEVRRYYSARAAEYDSGAHHRPEREPEVKSLEEWIPGRFDGKDVLEVACGTGRWSGLIASVARSLVATDASDEMLALARARVRAPHVRFVHADAYRLDAGLGLFQAAFAGFWLSHVPRARVSEFLQGLHQRLEPGASVVLVDNSDAHSQDVPVSDEDVDGNTFQTRQLADGSRFRVLKNLPSKCVMSWKK